MRLRRALDAQFRVLARTPNIARPISILFDMKIRKYLNPRLIAILVFLAICAASALALAACESPQEITGTRYSIWLDIGEENISCTQKVTFVNTSEYVLDELKFNVYANAYSSSSPLPCTPQEEADAYPNGVSFGKFNLDGAYGDFAACFYDAVENTITVTLSSPLLPTQETEIDFVYTITPPNTNLRYGYNEKCLSLTGFYPQLCALVDGEWFYRAYSPIGDPYFSDTADYEVCFNLPEECGYVASGLCREEVCDGETFVTACTDNIRDFALILSPVLSRTEEVYNGVNISYLGDNPEVIGYAKRALDVYSDRFGEYAYSSLALADVPFVAGGMEYGALCVINDSLQGADVESVTAHEIAHQWWYGAVGSNNLTDAWQDEGLAEYSTYLYFLDTDRREYAEILLDSAYTQYSKFVELGQTVGEPVKGMLAGELSSFASNYHYTNLTYNKAFIMWDTASKSMGDNLVKALRYYYERNKFSITSTDELFTALDLMQQGASTLIKNWIASC